MGLQITYPEPVHEFHTGTAERHTAEETIHRIRSQKLVTDKGLHRRLRKEVESDQYLRIRKGFYLRRDCLSPQESLWQHQRSIAIARHIAHYASQSHIEAFTHQSALLIRGLPILHTPVKVHERRQQSHGRRLASYPAVTFQGQAVLPSGLVVVHNGASLGDQAELLAGLPVTSLRETARDILAYSPPAAAVAEVSMLLRHASGYTRWARAESEARAGSIRQMWDEAIDEVPSVRRQKRAHDLLALCDPACESVAESYFNWFLHTFNAHPWQTQVELNINGSLFVADFCFPSQKVLIELEGFSKLGSGQQEIGRNLQALMRRDNLLTSQGWNLIHIPARQMYIDPFELYEHLRQVIASVFMPKPPRQWLLRG